MLDRVDRIQMAVAEAAPTARLFRDILGAEVVEDESDYLAPRWRGSGRAGPSSSRTDGTTTEAPS